MLKAVVFTTDQVVAKTSAVGIVSEVTTTVVTAVSTTTIEDRTKTTIEVVIIEETVTEVEMMGT